jgi:hypothetical protein
LNASIHQTIRAPPHNEAQSPPQVGPAEIAWLLLLPCAAVTVAAMLLLGSPLGHALSSAQKPIPLLPELRPFVFAKHTQQARYLIALVAPLLLVALTLAIAHRRPRLTPGVTGTLILVSQLAGMAFIGICLWAQHTHTYGPIYGYSTATYPHGFTQPYFTPQTLLVGGAFALVMAYAAKAHGSKYRLAILSTEPPSYLTVLVIAIAIGMTAIWALSGVNFEHTIFNAGGAISFNAGLPLDEVFAVLDGRSPLVNFIPQYGALWPYPIALAMSIFGTSFGVFSIAMCSLAGLSLLAVFDVLRRTTRNALAALALYLPFLATSLFAMEPGSVNRLSALTLYSDFPFRYAGPYILVWCLIRRGETSRPHTRWVVFTVAGLVIFNNVEFGIAATGATFIATLLIDTSLKPIQILRVVRDALIGLFAAYVLVSILTLIRANSLPHIGDIFFYARIYGGAGYGLLPTPTLGLHIVIYLTYATAIVLAAVRTIRRDPGRLTTGALAWSGIFGLGAGSYFMGRSHPEVLVTMFSAWSFSLALLVSAMVQQTLRDPRRRVTPARLMAFFAIGVTTCSLAQTPLPWTQIQRLRRRTSAMYVASTGLKQTLLRYGGHRPEAIMSVTGHRLAYETGIEDVSPYVGLVTTLTTEQLTDTFLALQAAGGSLLVLPVAGIEIERAACDAGFSFIRSVTGEPGQSDTLSLWSAPAPGVAPRSCRVT